MRKEPSGRYGSAEALADDLGRWLRGEPILARSVGSFGRFNRWCRRNRSLALASGLAVLFLLSSSVISVVFGIRQSDAAWLIGEEQEKTAKALKEARERSSEANLLSASLMLDRGLTFCEQGEIGIGVLWMARSVKLAPAGAVELQRAIRINLDAWGRQLHELQAILPHDSPVLSAAFSPDGRSVLTGSHDYAARFWETATGKPQGMPIMHPGKVRAVAWSPDGCTVVTVWADKLKASTWSTTAYTNSAIRALAAGTAQLFDVATRQPIGNPLNRGRVHAVAFSPDSRTVLTGHADKTAQLWNVKDGTPRNPVIQHEDEVWAVAFSPDGGLLATGSSDGTVRLSDAKTCKPIRPDLKSPPHPVWALAFSPDGSVLVTGQADGKCRFWDVQSSKLSSTKFTQPAAISALSVSPDGETILTGGYDKTARLWDRASGKRLGQPLRHGDLVQAALFSPDGRTILTAGWEGTARLWHPAKSGARDRACRFRAISRRWHLMPRAASSSLPRKIN